MEGTRKILIAVAAVALVAAVVPATQAQTSVGCGDVIKESVRVRSNLNNCPDNGLVVAGTNITIDLGGNTIDGSEDSDAGILFEKDFKRVTIRNGVISGFGSGVRIDTGGRLFATVTDLELLGNEVGIELDGADNVDIEGNTFIGNDDGIVVTGGESNLLDDNEFLDEAPAISVEGNENEITDNEIDYPDADDVGPAVIIEGNENLVSDTEILTGGTGIEITGDENEIEGNELEFGSGEGITVEGDDNLIENNEVTAYDHTAILVSGGEGNELIKNEAEENLDEGIVVEANETLIEKNDVEDSGNDGIHVEADNVVIVKNDVTDSGFDSGEGYGIFAEGEGIEGSDNDARGNANAKQCEPASLCE